MKEGPVIQIEYESNADRIFVSFPHEGRVGYQVRTDRGRPLRQTDIVPLLRSVSAKVTREINYIRHPEIKPERVIEFNLDDGEEDDLG